MDDKYEWWVIFGTRKYRMVILPSLDRVLQWIAKNGKKYARIIIRRQKRKEAAS